MVFSLSPRTRFSSRLVTVNFNVSKSGLDCARLGLSRSWSVNFCTIALEEVVWTIFSIAHTEHCTPCPVDLHDAVSQNKVPCDGGPSTGNSRSLSGRPVQPPPSSGTHREYPACRRRRTIPRHAGRTRCSGITNETIPGKAWRFNTEGSDVAKLGCPGLEVRVPFPSR